MQLKIKTYLSRHDFAIGASNLDASVHAGTIVSLQHGTTVGSVTAHRAIVGTLGTRKALLGPAEGMTVPVQQGIFLLNAEPGLSRRGSIHGLLACYPPVGLCKYTHPTTVFY